MTPVGIAPKSGKESNRIMARERPRLSYRDRPANELNAAEHALDEASI